jgi:hypothetical protein
MVMAGPNDNGIRRLAYEIRNKRNTILEALFRYKRNTRAVKIGDVRHDLSILQGMVWAYLYASERWTHHTPLELNEEVNELIMLQLSVDLIKMRNEAYGLPNSTPDQDSLPGS